MIDFWDELVSALERGENFVLCSIVSCTGSSPRKAGTYMAVFESGEILGSIGGGAVEKAAMEQAGILHQTKQSAIREFSLTSGSKNDIGMICGGEMVVSFQFFGSEDDKTRGTLLRMREQALREQGRVYLFGGGHISRELAPLLSRLDFHVTVFDDRPDYSEKKDFPGTDAVILGNYSAIGEKLSIEDGDYVVVLTSGHQADFAVLEQVLRTGAAYIGCIGSRKKAVELNLRLSAAGIPESGIARIHSPVGLPVKAETPAEIAVSIAAEMILHRAENRTAVNMVQGANL